MRILNLEKVIALVPVTSCKSLASEPNLYLGLNYADITQYEI